jgi:hypothetical protein
MRGFPKTIGTKQDMKNLLAMPEFAEQAYAKLDEFESASKVWVTVKKLGTAEPGLTSESHRVSLQEEADGKVERYQQELQEDPESAYARLDLATLKQPDSKLVDPELPAEGV